MNNKQKYKNPYNIFRFFQPTTIRMNKKDSRIPEKTELQQKIDGMKKYIDSLETNLEIYGSKTDN